MIRYAVSASPDPSSLQALSNEALARVLFAMRRALVERRQLVEVSDFRFRFQRRGEEFDDPEDSERSFEARESGVFVFCRATAGGVDVPGRWLHLGSSDDLEDLMKPYLNGLSAKQLDELLVVMSANAVLQTMADERAASRRVHALRTSAGAS